MCPTLKFDIKTEKTIEINRYIPEIEELKHITMIPENTILIVEKNSFDGKYYESIGQKDPVRQSLFNIFKKALLYGYNQS